MSFEHLARRRESRPEIKSAVTNNGIYSRSVYALLRIKLNYRVRKKNKTLYLLLLLFTYFFFFFRKN